MYKFLLIFVTSIFLSFNILAESKTLKGKLSQENSKTVIVTDDGKLELMGGNPEVIKKFMNKDVEIFGEVAGTKIVVSKIQDANQDKIDQAKREKANNRPIGFTNGKKK